MEFDQQYWLGVTVGAGPEMTPRTKLTASAYSLNARSVADGAVTEDKIADNVVTTAKIQPDVVSSVDGVSNDGGNIDLIPQNAVTITPDDAANTITIGESHSAKTDNPHSVTAAQAGALVSVDGVSNAGGNIDLVPGPNVTITPNDTANTITISAIGGSESWSLTGNAGTVPGTYFLGTTDNQPLEFRVYNSRVLRLEPYASGPNVIAGSGLNSITSGAYGSTIGGGTSNKVTDFLGTVSGGQSNQAGDNAGSTGDASAATVSGGALNHASGIYTTVGGGCHNEASSDGATTGGGSQNDASEFAATIAGGSYNEASGDYATVGGGTENKARGQHSTIGGGYKNKSHDNSSTVAGGSENEALYSYSAIGGGKNNVTYGDYTVIAGGSDNRILDRYCTIGGGCQNQAGENEYVLTPLYITIGGGCSNEATGQYSTIGGGNDNQATGLNASIGGGYRNKSNRDCATVAGGSENQAFRYYAAIGGGRDNVVNGDYTVIAGGRENSIPDSYCTVGGGYQNVAGNDDSVLENLYITIGGGYGNSAIGLRATIGGGYMNVSNSNSTVVAGGRENQATGGYSAVGGGRNNVASGLYSVIPGGYNNTATSAYSFAAGSNARAQHVGTFVWGDYSTESEVASTDDNQFLIRASGGSWIYSDSELTSGVRLSPGSSTLATLSDRNMKENIHPVDAKKILRKLSQIPVSRWNYKTQDSSIKHIGPMAQDFYAAFGLGEDGRHISTVDPDGVALAAIQGLYELVKEKDAQIAELETRMKALEVAK